MKKKYEVLFISMFAPYDTVSHAGGKVHNFYVKELQKRQNVHQTLISKCYAPELGKMDLDEYGIDNDIVVLDKSLVYKTVRKIISMFSYINPLDKYGNTLLDYERYKLKEKIRAYHLKGYKPDIIILQWTQIIFLVPYLKKLFPTSKFVAIEEDVLFLNFKRRIDLSKSFLTRWKAKYQYGKVRKIELNSLKEVDLIVTNNFKDTDILLENGIPCEKLYTSSVFFDNYSETPNRPIGKDILFYGAMNRAENYLSVLWFIDNVFSKISDPDVKLYIVGGNPVEKIKKIKNERIIVTGFVNDVAKYFQECICLVAPLVLGAGIKVKVLEAMSAGIPVLTNDIGIEGINAKDGVHFFYCKEPSEYLKVIEGLINGTIRDDITEEAIKFIKDNYDIHEKVNVLYDRILKD